MSPLARWQLFRARKHAVAFTLGMEVGRMLSAEQAASLKTRVGDLY